MESIEQALRDLTRKLLEEKQVDLIIGYGLGTLPLSTQPLFVYRVEDCQNLIWNESCDINLVKLIPKTEQKIGIIVKKCDAKSLIILLQENQIKRNRITIIAVPCTEGIIDKKKIGKIMKERELLGYQTVDQKIILKGNQFEIEIPKTDVLSVWCASCDHNPPVDYDHLLGSQENFSGYQNENRTEYNDLIEFEQKSTEERWTYFQTLLKSCTRCYSCRNACPLCYCNECFVDQNIPQWFGKSPDISENILFHLIRAFHLAGRCVGCGACSRACPVDIDLTLINKKIRHVVEERFKYHAGDTLEKSNPLASYSLEDQQEFIITDEREE